MNSVKALKQLLVSKGVAAADTVKSFSKLKEMVNKAHAMRIPMEEDYMSGPRRAIRKVYCSTNSINGYEENTGLAGLNGMVKFSNALPNLKSIQEIRSPIELACSGLMVPAIDCESRTTCNCNQRDSCDCRSTCDGKGRMCCDCKSRCACNGRTNPDCGTRSTCNCYTVAVEDTVKLCTCESVLTY